MAVEVVYRSSRDPERLFMDKAEADRHDKMLELAERLAEVLHKAVPSLSEKQVEEAGIYMAKTAMCSPGRSRASRMRWPSCSKRQRPSNCLHWPHRQQAPRGYMACSIAQVTSLPCRSSLVLRRG